MKKLVIITLFIFNFSLYPMEGNPQLPSLVSNDENEGTVIELQEEFRECSFAQMPNEILFSIIKHMIPREKLATLSEELIIDFTPREFKKYTEKLSKFFFNLSNLSRSNNKCYRFMNESTKILSDFLIKKLHLLTHANNWVDREYLEKFINEIYNWFENSFLSGQSSTLSLPVKKIVMRIKAQVELVDLINLYSRIPDKTVNDFFINESKRILEEYNLNPDNIMIYTDNLLKNQRLLIYYLQSLDKTVTDPRFLELLLDKGANPNYVTGLDTGNTPLFCAISKKLRETLLKARNIK